MPYQTECNGEASFSRFAKFFFCFWSITEKKKTKSNIPQHKLLCSRNNVENAGMSVTEAVKMAVKPAVAAGARQRHHYAVIRAQSPSEKH